MELRHRQIRPRRNRIRQAKATGLRNLSSLERETVWLETVLTAPLDLMLGANTVATAR